MDHMIITPMRSCPVCGIRSGKAFGKTTYALFDDLDISGTKTLVCCNGCGMVYDDVTFTEQELHKYYRFNEHCTISSIGGGGSISNDNNERYDRIIDLLDPDCDELVIDYGCGQGGFVARCRQRGLRSVGIETSAKRREVACSSDLPVYESMDAFIAANKGFTVHSVVFSHVLEHLINPINLVYTVKQYVEDSLIYIEVPDADSYLSERNVRWGEMYFEHVCHFRKNHLQELARRLGIEIIKERIVSFSKYLKDTRCLYILGRFSGTLNNHNEPNMTDVHPISTLPSLSVKPTHDDSPLALWGVSQYTMLLLGSCNELAGRINRLFDASPAKIGRSINGIIIEPSENLGTLSKDFYLLIPKSYFLPQMLTQLSTTGFRGTVQIV